MPRKEVDPVPDEGESLDESTRAVRSFLRSRSVLPDDGNSTALTLGVVVNLFSLFLRQGEKLVAYADRIASLTGMDESKCAAVEVVALTDQRLVRSRIGSQDLAWKEVSLPTEAAVGLEASLGHPSETDPRWWIEDEPRPPRFYIELPWALVVSGEESRRWEWSAAGTAWARRPLLTLNAWSEGLGRTKRQQ
jgi:hypothetical protein